MLKKNYVFRSFTSVTLCLILLMSMFFVPIPVYAATNKTITVDFSQEKGTMTPLTGWLLTPNEDIPDGRIIPLKTPICRDDADVQNITGYNTFDTTTIFASEYNRLTRMKKAYDRLNSLGIEYYPVLAYTPSWLSTNGTTQSPPNDYSLWKQWIKDNVQYAKDNNLNITKWDIWNEYLAINSTQYNEMYKQAWNAIKEIIPNAMVCGPSAGYYDPNDERSFIDYCQTNGLTIGGLAWHDMANIWDVSSNIADIKGYANSKPDVGIQQYFVEEYQNTNSIGELVNWFTSLIEGKADVGIRAVWDSPNGLSDMLTTNALATNICARNLKWWTMKAYAELSGKRVSVTQNYDGTAAIAAKDTTAGEAKILVANKGADTVNLTLNLNNQPFAGQTVRIDKYQVTGTENDGLVLQATENPASNTNIATTVSLGTDDVWLVVIKKTASAPGSFCLKAPDDGTVAGTTPTFSWQAASGATSYTLKVSTNKDMSNPVVNQSGITGTSYTLSSALTVGTQYYWTVSAANSNGTSPAANNMYYSFTPVSNTNIPGGFTMMLLPDGSVGTDLAPKFTWSQSYNATSYTLLVDNNSDFSSPEVNQNITSPTIESTHCNTLCTYTLTSNLTANTTYYAKIVANNANGSRQMNGPAHVFTTKPSGNNPGSFSLSSPSNGATNVSRRAKLDWSDSNGGFFYKLEIATDSAFNNIIATRNKITVSSYTLEPDLVSANTQYYWRVTAYSKDSAYATTASNNTYNFTTENLPCSPLLKTVSAGGGSVSVYFSTVSGATSYKVKYGTSPGNYTNTLNNVISSPYTVTGLNNGTTYYFAVVATNANGDSTVFNEVSAVPNVANAGQNLEAENAQMFGGAGTYADSAASGGYGVGYMGNNGSGITFNNLMAGSQLKIRYAALNNGTFSLYKNGTHVQDISFASTGAWTGSGAYADNIIDISITSGDSITLQKDSSDVAINVDYILVMAGQNLEAENAQMFGGAGTYADSAASGGYGVGYMGNNGSGITFNNLPSGSQLKIRYATINSGTFSLYKNGTHVQDISFASTGAWTGSGAYADNIVNISIASGDSITLQKDSSDVPINVDYIVVMTSSGNTNLALNKTITANYTLPGYDATKANDGVVAQNSYWQGDNSFPHTLTVDLGSSYSISKVVIKLPTNWGSRTQTFSVLGSTDGSTFNTILNSATYTFDPASSNIVNVTFSNTNVRYVRLNFTANSAASGGQASEFEVY